MSWFSQTFGDDDEKRSTAKQPVVGDADVTAEVNYHISRLVCKFTLSLFYNYNRFTYFQQQPTLQYKHALSLILFL